MGVLCDLASSLYGTSFSHGSSGIRVQEFQQTWQKPPRLPGPTSEITELYFTVLPELKQPQPIQIQVEGAVDPLLNVKERI